MDRSTAEVQIGMDEAEADRLQRDAQDGENGGRMAADLAAMKQLQEISTLLIQEDDVHALYRRIVDAAVAVMNADAASLQMLDRKCGELRLLESKGFHPTSAKFWEWVRADSSSSCGAALASGKRTLVDDVEDCDFMSGTADLEEFRRSGLRAVQSTPLVSRSGKALGMMSTHWCQPHRPSERDLQMLDVLARQAADLIERNLEAERSRRVERAAQQLATIVESSDDAIASKDLNGIIQTWNRGAERLFGYSAEEAVGRPVNILIPADHEDEEPHILARIRRGESISHYDTVRQRKDGALIDISLTVSPIKDESGQIVGASKIARNISERRAADAHRELLLHELSHRVKNTLATVQSIAMQTLHNAPDRKTFQKDFVARLIALGHTHELLMRSNWHGASLHDLMALELAPFEGSETPRWTASGDYNFRVNAKTALALGMALHELTTNAAKYGALSTLEGTIAVRWQVHEVNGAQCLHFEWIERGGPPVTQPTRRGFGSRLIEQGLKHELRAGVKLDYKRGGLHCLMDIPLDTAQAILAVGAMS
ncbi:MAG TPA: PAS domain S-box protein [Gammaproteobacteria bacterium]|nr:PAS domain S-box protein [Gammaproteobacteria bacterium]